MTTATDPTAVDYGKTTKSDIFMTDPRSLLVDWADNVSREGRRPEVDEELMELARSMVPGETGESGQRNPIICRPLQGGQKKVIGGFRRLAALLWAIDSGLWPDARIKYVCSRMSPQEAALANLIENIQRQDPTPLQLAHAVRSLTEHYGMSLDEIATRLRKSKGYLSTLLDIPTLPESVQNGMRKGRTTLTAAIELTKAPEEDQEAIHDELSQDGEKVTAAKVREKRREKAEPTERIKRTPKDLAAFIELKTGPAEPGAKLACYLIDYLDGKLSQEVMEKHWDRAFE